MLLLFSREFRRLIIVLCLLMMTFGDCKMPNEESSQHASRSKRQSFLSNLFNNAEMGAGSSDEDEPLPFQGHTSGEPKYNPPSIQRNPRHKHRKPPVRPPPLSEDEPERPEEQQTPPEKPEQESFQEIFRPPVNQIPRAKPNVDPEEEAIMQSVQDWRENLINDATKMDRQMTLINKILGYQRKKLQEAMTAESSLLSKIIALLVPKQRWKKPRAKRDIHKTEFSDEEKIKVLLKYISRSRLKNWNERVRKLNTKEKARLLLYLNQFKHLRRKHAILYKSVSKSLDGK